MDIFQAEAIIDEIRGYCNLILFRDLDNGQTVSGSAYCFNLQNPYFERVEIIFFSEVYGERINSAKPMSSGAKFSLKIHPVSGGEPFRIETDNRNPQAHINTADPLFHWIALNIPNKSRWTFGTAGSAVAGYFNLIENITIAELLVMHYNCLDM